MTNRLRAKHKIERRYGTMIWDDESSPVTVRSYGPGQHGPKPKKRSTEYKNQLSEKQKLKGFYGDISEKQFRKFFEQSQQEKGHTGTNFISKLEMMLVSCVYRAKWAVSPFMARQCVNHNHVRVNGKKVNIKTYRLRLGDVVTLDEKMQKNQDVMRATESPRDVPGYMDVQGFEAKFTRLPDFQEVPYSFRVDLKLITEYYSR